MSYVDEVLAVVQKKNADQPEFLQAVEEVLFSMQPLFEKESKYQENAILERIVVPERLIRIKHLTPINVLWKTDSHLIKTHQIYDGTKDCRYLENYI